jgi:hypothetical protein
LPRNRPSHTLPSMESVPATGTRSSFTQSCPDWREGTYDNFKGWALKHFDTAEMDSDEEAEVPVHFKKAKNIEFEKNSKGIPILPDMADYRTTRQRQRVVRGYIGAVYSKQNKGLLFRHSDLNHRGIYWKQNCGLPLYFGIQSRPDNLFD